VTYGDALGIVDRVMAQRLEQYPGDEESRERIRHKIAKAVSLLRSGDENESRRVLFESLLVAEQSYMRYQAVNA
jgi:hypothetical protein